MENDFHQLNKNCTPVDSPIYSNIICLLLLKSTFIQKIMFYLSNAYRLITTLLNANKHNSYEIIIIFILITIQPRKDLDKTL